MPIRMRIKLMLALTAALSFIGGSSHAADGYPPPQVVSNESYKNQEKWEKKRTEFHEDMAHKLTKAQKELTELRQQAATHGNAMSPASREALEKAAADLERFESSVNDITTANQATWETVRTAAKESSKQAEKSLDLADRKID